MKTLVIITAMIALLVSACLAQETPAAEQEPQVAEQVMPIVKAIMGEITKLDVASTTSGTLEVTDPNGAIVGIKVDAETKIYDASLFAVGISNLKEKDNVKISYKELPDGINKAQSINIVK